MKKLSAVFAAILMMGLLSVSAYANGNANLFPITYSAFGNTYTFTGYELSKNNGNIMIVMSGSGYGLPADYNFNANDDLLTDVAVPVTGSITAGGVTYSCHEYSAISGSLSFTFKASVTPETFTIKNKETGAVVAAILLNDSSAVITPVINPPAATPVSSSLIVYTNDKLPITFTSHGKAIAVESYILGVDEFGDAYIHLIGNGNNDFIYNDEGHAYLFGRAQVEINGTRYTANWNCQRSFSFGSTFPIADYVPTKIWIYNADTGEVIAEIDHTASKGAPMVFDSLPLTYSSHGYEYTVTGFEITENEEGKTRIILYGDGYKNVYYKEKDDLEIPAEISFIVTDPYLQVYDYAYCLQSDQAGGFLQFDFETTDKPEIIILSNRDTGEILGAFPANFEELGL